MADKKRKGLMSLLTEYQNENNKSGLTKDGDSKTDIAEARKRQAKVKAQASKPKPKPATKKTGSKKTAPKKDTGKSPFLGRTDGVRGESLPSNPKLKSQPKPPRKKRPSTGRTGEAAAKRANRPKARPAKTMTVAQRRAMRLRARRGR